MKRSFIFFFHPQNFLREVLVGTGAAGKKVKIKNRFSETWRFGETHASGNNTVENFSRKMIFHFADNLGWRLSRTRLIVSRSWLRPSSA